MLFGCTPWPAEIASSYVRAGYWTAEHLGQLIDRQVAEQPHRLALITPAGTTTYAELHAHAERLAAALQGLGIRPQDRVVVQLPNGVEFVALSLALFRLGALPVFALPAYRHGEIAHFCRHTEAVAYVMPGVYRGFDYGAIARQVRDAVPSLRYVIAAEGHQPAGDQLSLCQLDASTPAVYPRIDPGDVAFFLVSGSAHPTPQLIPRTHHDYVFQCRATADALGVTTRTVYLAALPVAHNATLGCPGVLGTLRAGGTVVMTRSPSPDEVFPVIEREGVTMTTVMPSVLKLWLDVAAFSPVDLSGVTIQVGGAPLDPAVARAAMQRWRASLTHWFGMAEGFLSCTRLTDSEDVIAGSVGTPLCAADDARVVDAEGRDVVAGESGELLVRGPYTLRGYYRSSEYNRVAFTPEGYLRTGDLVRIAADGNMVVTGRIKDVVNRGGEKVPAREVEQQLLRHPAVRRARIVGRPDARLGEKTVAVVDATPPVPGDAELRQFLRSVGLAEFKLPDEFQFVDEAVPSGGRS